jgi:hypothetical protein
MECIKNNFGRQRQCECEQCKNAVESESALNDLLCGCKICGLQHEKNGIEYCLAASVSEIASLRFEIRKLKSMCKAAADEIDSQWEHHCDKDGYGPVNLMGRLEGKMKADLYPGFDT